MNNDTKADSLPMPPSSFMIQSHLGAGLAIDHWPGERTGILALHGLDTHAKTWWPVASRLAARGHAVATMDMRGHGRSEKVTGPYDFETICAEVVEVISELNRREQGPWTTPLVAGQSWGANVAMELAWRADVGICGIVCVDGGTIELSSSFATWELCSKALAPPSFDSITPERMRASLRARHPDWDGAAIEATMANFDISEDSSITARLPRAMHMEILHSLWQQRPSLHYGEVHVPVLLLPVAGRGTPGGEAKRTAIQAATAALEKVSVHWFESGDHDVHIQKPDQVAEVMESHFQRNFFMANAGPGRDVAR